MPVRPIKIAGATRERFTVNERSPADTTVRTTGPSAQPVGRGAIPVAITAVDSIRSRNRLRSCVGDLGGRGLRPYDAEPVGPAGVL